MEGTEARIREKGQRWVPKDARLVKISEKIEAKCRNEDGW